MHVRAAYDMVRRISRQRMWSVGRPGEPAPSRIPRRAMAQRYGRSSLIAEQGAYEPLCWLLSDRFRKTENVFVFSAVMYVREVMER